MTAADVVTAYNLLQDLTQLQSQKASFDQADTFVIEGTKAGSILGTASFPAASYLTALDAAFETQIAALTMALTNLGVTGF